MTDASLAADELQDVFVGDHVADREDDDATLLVVAVSPQQANEYDVGEATVADYNEEYPEDDDVVEVVYAQRTCVDIENARRYAFPRSRLRVTAPAHDLDADQEAN
jgi:hypothetical protein